MFWMLGTAQDTIPPAAKLMLALYEWYAPNLMGLDDNMSGTFPLVSTDFLLTNDLSTSSRLLK